MTRSILLACALVLVPTTAFADDDEEEEQMVIVEPAVADPGADPAPESPPVMVVRPVPPPKEWVEISYSSETLLLDGAAVSMFAFGMATKTEPLPALGVLTYGFAAPVAHFTHGNVGKGLADLGIRIVSPFLFAVPGLMIAIAATPNDHDERKTAMDIGGFAGMALGAAFAMAVDALVLAKERVPAERAYMVACGRCSARGSQP
jgi:hypothetical protein